STTYATPCRVMPQSTVIPSLSQEATTSDSAPRLRTVNPPRVAAAADTRPKTRRPASTASILRRNFIISTPCLQSRRTPAQTVRMTEPTHTISKRHDAGPLILLGFSAPSPADPRFSGRPYPSVPGRLGPATDP